MTALMLTIRSFLAHLGCIFVLLAAILAGTSLFICDRISVGVGAALDLQPKAGTIPPPFPPSCRISLLIVAAMVGALGTALLSLLHVCPRAEEQRAAPKSASNKPLSYIFNVRNNKIQGTLAGDIGGGGVGNVTLSSNSADSMDAGPAANANPRTNNGNNGRRGGGKGKAKSAKRARRDEKRASLGSPAKSPRPPPRSPPTGAANRAAGKAGLAVMNESAASLGIDLEEGGEEEGAEPPPPPPSSTAKKARTPHTPKTASISTPKKRIDARSSSSEGKQQTAAPPTTRRRAKAAAAAAEGTA